jgi:hypothetical protein
MKNYKQKKRKVINHKSPKRKAAKQQAAITEFLGVPHGEWVWCLHCQRCYRVGEQRHGRDGLEYCHYQDCDGDAFIDVSTWQTVRFFYPHYPEVPERNMVYQCDAELGGVW